MIFCHNFKTINIFCNIQYDALLNCKYLQTQKNILFMSKNDIKTNSIGFLSHKFTSYL